MLCPSLDRVGRWTRTARATYNARMWWTQCILALGVLSLPAIARADAPEVTAEPAAGVCFPTCRAGYLCAPNGTCVSECNPPCADGESCARGMCLREAAAHPAPASPAPLVDISVRAGGVCQY